MKKHFVDNFLIYFFGLTYLFFSILFPKVEIVLSGGFAWFTLFLAWLLGLSLCWISIMGGSISYESKGLIGWIKEWRSSDKDK